MMGRSFDAATKRDAALLGARLKEARLRRRLIRKNAADRAGISDKTAYDIERGAPGVAIGNVLSYMTAVGQRRIIQAIQDPLGDPLIETHVLEQGRKRAR